MITQGRQVKCLFTSEGRLSVTGAVIAYVISISLLMLFFFCSFHLFVFLCICLYPLLISISCSCSCFRLVLQGDSGGPLVVEKDESWYIVGIVSGGAECGAPYSPNFYTRVTELVEWINDVINLR